MSKLVVIQMTLEIELQDRPVELASDSPEILVGHSRLVRDVAHIAETYLAQLLRQLPGTLQDYVPVKIHIAGQLTDLLKQHWPLPRTPTQT